jgi:hypothetical protein
MNKSDKKFSQNDYTPKRFALKYNPSQIVIEYLVPSTGKLYHHKIRLNQLKSESNIQEVIKEIYEKHFLYLDTKKINPTQIIRLVEKLYNCKYKNEEIKKTTNSNPNLSSSSTKIKEPKKEEDDIEEEEDYYKFFDYDNEDLNKLESSQLQKRKDVMEKLYSKNAILPGDQEFVFDLRVIYIF